MSSQVIVVGVAGASGSGKSLLSTTIVEELGSRKAVVIREDAYYKDLSHMPMEGRDKVNYDHPDAFDHALLIQHLRTIKSGGAIDVPVYDYSIHNRCEETVHIDQNKYVIVVEGILLFVEPQLRELMDIKIFVDTPPDICFIRRLQRDVIERGRTMESVIAQYQKTVRPMFTKFIEPSKRYADIIVPHGGKNRIAIELIQARLKQSLH